jgi:glycosyltransferase involved in cell wall biosynthesis
LAIGSDGKFRIIYFGGLSLRKGIHDLLAAFQLARIPNSELVLMGAIAPETDHLMAPYRSLGGVVVTGHVSQAKAREWFARSSVFVLPSIEDGFGLVLAEAQACGLPVIATENSGGPDVIREGENGYVVPIRNPPAIAERLVWLSENSDQLRAMGAAALSRVAEFRGWDNFADTMVSRYHALLNPSEDEFPPSDVAGT